MRVLKLIADMSKRNKTLVKRKKTEKKSAMDLFIESATLIELVS